MNSISNDDIRVVNWIKSARVGATKIMLAATGYFAEHKRRNQVFYQPTNGTAEDFCKTEIDTMLRDVPCMQAIFPYFGKKSSRNTMKFKQFEGSTLRVLGTETGDSFRRISVDCVFFDELESMNPDVDKEGSPIKLGDKRLEGSLFPKSVRMTTPRMKKSSLIEPQVENSDYLFKYAVPCPHCNEDQVLVWDNLKWHGNDSASVYYQCEHNACTIHNSDLNDMIVDGVWIDVERGVWIDEDDKFRDRHNRIIDTPQRVSFHIWTIYSPFVTWSTIVSEFIIANNIFKTQGDVSELKTFRNTTLGETWVDDEGEKFEPEQLYERREPYPNTGFNRNGLFIVGGFDMQDNRVEGKIKVYGLDNESWLIDRFVIYGNPATPKLWDELEEQCNKIYTREDGKELPIGRICFDSGGHFASEVYSFSRRMGVHFVIPTKGSSTYQQPLTRFPNKLTDQGVYLTMIGTDTAKDIVYNRLKITNPTPDEPMAAMCHFPLAEWCDMTYFNQLCAESRIPKRVSGKTIMVYDAGGRRNEMIDCEVGCLAAMKISVENYGVNLDELSQKAQNPKLRTTMENSLLEAARKLRV